MLAACKPQVQYRTHCENSDLASFVTAGGGFDPLTGDGGVKLHYCPKQSYIFFNMVRPVAPMVTKIKGFNLELDSTDDSIGLTEQELSGL